MRSFRNHLIYGHGFSLAELLVVIGMIGILSAVAIPIFVNFLQAQQARGAAQELVNLLNQARQLAIATNRSYRVEIESGDNRLRFVRTSDDVAWTGLGTDDQGYRRLENQARLVNVTANPTFNHLGTGSAGTITVQDAQGSSTLRVRVSTGRIWICGVSNCP